MRNPSATLLLILGMFVIACRGNESPTAPNVNFAPTPPPSFPKITSVAPPIAPPEGGSVVRINGANFVPPMRVFFEGAGTTMEAYVAEAQLNSIQVITPPFQLSNVQRIDVNVRVVVNAGSTYEQSTTRERALAIQEDVLRPAILAITPNRASIGGGTRLTIFGEGFQAPLQVFFEQHGERFDSRVLSTSYSEIVIEVPAARHTGPADVIVRNWDSGRETRLANRFQYLPAPTITAVSPAHGPASGGTHLRITGTGFEAPVMVTLGTIPATVLRVTSTQIDVLTPASRCNEGGPVTVVKVISGETATGPSFKYECSRRRAV